jgi:UDP:flavonoid glycosyltransferase YjiC (YdhE family)
MRIAIVTIGTLGDVLPYIALGKELQADGNQVTLVTFEQFEELIHQHRLDFAPLRGNINAFMTRNWTQSQVKSESRFRALYHMSQVSKTTRQRFVHLMTDALQGCAGADLIVGQIVGHLIAPSVAEKLGVPYCSAFLAPIHRTQAFPGSFSLFPSTPGWHGRGKGLYNWLTATLSARLFWSFARPILQQARQTALELPPARTSPVYPVVYGYSPFALPKPHEWGENITVTGYWLLDQEEAWQPPADLLAFLEAGAPPVYVGFGSTSRAVGATTRTAVQVLSDMGHRCIILGNQEEWEEFQVSETVYCLKWAPHSWLFSRVAAVMHHGGAGTTGAALRAGVPQIVVPFIADQYFWGSLVEALHVGPAPLTRKKRSNEYMRQALLTATADATRRRAWAVGVHISEEDGLALAAQIIQSTGSATPASVTQHVREIRWLPRIDLLDHEIPVG